jgi:hypothetical protein
MAVISREALVVRRLESPAAGSRYDALFAARAALKRALVLRRDADLQVDQLRALVARLETKT